MRQDDPQNAASDQSFAPTQMVESMAKESSPRSAPPVAAPNSPPPRANRWAALLTTLRRVTRLLRAAASRQLATMLSPDNRGRAGLLGLIVLLSAALAWKSVQPEAAAMPPTASVGALGSPVRDDVEQALARGDSVMVLALLAKDDSAAALLLRADALVRLGRNAEAFELLDRAARVAPAVRSEPAFVRGAVAALSAVAAARVATLLRDTPDELVRQPLTEALGSADYRQRHGAQYVLTQRGEQVDDTAILSMDLLQLSDCDAKAAVAKALVRRLDAKPDIEHVVAYAKSRDRDGCLSGIVARKAQPNK